MAGYAIGFDDGGEFEEYRPEPVEGDVSRVMPEQSTGNLTEEASHATPEDPNATPTSGLLSAAENTPPIQGLRSIASYLMGKGATPPQEAQRVVNDIKNSTPGLTDDDANLLAVDQAGKMGGPAAAWGMVQYNRLAYNAKQSFAKAALNGIDGKAGDIVAATDAATKAGAHILDGSSAVFTAAGPDQITATVTDPNTRKRETFRLTRQQFNDYLDVGKTSQWDRMTEEGIPATVAKVAQGGAAPAQAPATAQGEESNFGKTPSTLDLSGGAPRGDLRGYKPMDYSAMDDNNASLVARANQLFPSASQQDQRAAWISAQSGREEEMESRERQAEAGMRGKERIAAIQGGARTQAAQTRAGAEVQKQGIRTEGNKDVARINAQARADSDKQKALQAIEKMDRSSRDAKMREAGRMARAELTNPNMLLQKPEDVARILNKYGISGVAGEAALPPTGAAAPAPQAGRPAGVPAGAKLYKGKWYTRGPNGEAVEVQQ